MNGKFLPTVIIAVLVTALIAGGGMFLLRSRQIVRLENQVAAREREKEAAEEQVEELERRVAELEAQVEGGGERPPTDTEITRFPKPGWEDYFPTAETTTLQNEPVGRVRDLLGEPPFLIRSIAANPQFNREIWIYNASEEDPTGLYLFFKANRLDSSRLDEFTGLFGSGLLDIEEFWLNNGN